MRDAVDRIVDLPTGAVLAAPGERLDHSALLIDGVVGRFKELRDDERQITELHVAGDFVDLPGYLLKRLEHHIGALSPVRVAYVPHSALTMISEQWPHLARMLWLTTIIDSAAQRERIMSIGRRSAISRIAHLFCELCIRLNIVGRADGHNFALRITQIDIADVTGLTPVHVNRMLRQLRCEGLLTFRAGRAEIHDLPGLEQIAEFDRAYLFLDSEPR